MVKIVPVDRERHGGKGWRHPMGYGFVAGDIVAPLSGSEFASALPAMPIGFVAQSGQYMPVALLALTKGSNVFAEPTGQWLGAEGAEQATLGIDEDSGLILDEVGESVEKFFEADGTPSAPTKALTEFRRRLEHDQAITNRAVAALAEAGVIKPWPLTVPVGDQQVTVNGFYRVDEPALNALDDEAFLKLRKASALVIAPWATSLHGAGQRAGSTDSYSSASWPKQANKEARDLRSR
jgi:hypothetical protein